MACVIREALVRVGPRASLGRAGASRRAPARASRLRARSAATNEAEPPGLAPKVHFLGIGGAGMSALAIIALFLVAPIAFFIQHEEPKPRSEIAFRLAG